KDDLVTSPHPRSRSRCPLSFHDPGVFPSPCLNATKGSIQTADLFELTYPDLHHGLVEAIEAFSHVCRAGCNIYPRRRSKPKHRLRPVQYGQQTFQCSRIKSTTYFYPTSAS